MYAVPLDFGQSDNGVYVGVGAENVEIVEVVGDGVGDDELLLGVSLLIREAPLTFTYGRLDPYVVVEGIPSRRVFPPTAPPTAAPTTTIKTMNATTKNVRIFMPNIIRGGRFSLSSNACLRAKL